MQQYNPTMFMHNSRSLLSAPFYRLEGVRVQSHWQNQLPSSQPAKSCNCPQGPPLLQLCNQGAYISSYLSVIKRGLSIIVMPSGQLLAITIVMP